MSHPRGAAIRMHELQDEDEDESTALDSPAQRAEMASTPGARIGRFVLLRQLGAGGMGVVYSAYDEELDRRVAIKLLHRHDDRNDRNRMRREAQSLAKLSHPNVVAIYEVGEHAGRLFLAMEYVKGPTMREWLSAQPRALDEILGVLRQAGEGLAAAHDVGLVHRDFKPGNVLVADDGRTRVLDFGLARRFASATDELTDGSLSGDVGPALDDLTEAGTVMGTPSYMPPEQFAGTATDARSDQWSFCVTAWEAVYGQRPFVGRSYAGLAEEVRRGRVQPPPSSRDVPGWILPVLMRGLAVDPARRHPDMRSLIAALDRTPRRRGAWGLAVVGMIGVLSLGYAMGIGMGGSSSCVDGADRLESLWDPDVRAELREAFMRTAIPHAEVGFVTASNALDDFASTWKEVHLQVCEVPPGPEGTTLFDREMACLDDHQRAFRAVVEVLVQADPGAVEHAVQLAASLPSPRRCGDAEALLASIPLPPPELAEPVGAVREQLASASAQRFAGHLVEAERLARAAFSEATGLGHAPLEVEAKARLGAALVARSELEPARELLEDAYWQALRIGYDEQSVEIAILLIHIVGDRLQRVDEGLSWFRQGEALAARAGIDDVRLAWILNNAGNTHLHAARFEEGRALFERALDIAERADPPNPEAIASFLNNLGALEYQRGNREASHRHQLRSLELRVANLGPTHPSVVSNLINLGNIELDDGRIDDARSRFVRALEVIGVNGNLDRIREAFTLLGLARVASAQGEHREGVEQFQRGLEILQEAFGPRHPTVGLVMVSAGEEFDVLGRADEALDHVERGLAIAEPALGSDHPDVLAARSTRARLRAQRGEHAEMVAVYGDIAVDAERVLGAEHRLVGEALKGQGLSLVAVGRHAEAVGVLERALAMHEADEDERARLEIERGLKEASGYTPR
ncbi:serine/threonine-protein kinase [Paraliomyxa miuraensis]|uniref:serine/threonine-protein kinase n=1 Tax=Paraliomyxa miuraensis TaxID=376150 RepID=UPI002256C9D8|nr:serine/threonine-protein kinase [Paraliomyxa miuraensis]MCX4239916.1 serine/threonine-protein kinase [Paraliomyxa miuraensis]